MDVRPQDPLSARPLLACADDLGADAANDECIIELLQQVRLSGASVLVDGANAAAAARVPNDRGVGLHLNLTEDFGQGFAVRPVSAWILDAWRGRIDRDLQLRAHLAAEIDRQLARCAQLAGRPPDYVDGHEHVHGLPAIAALLAERLARAGAPATLVRQVRTRRWRGIKAGFISLVAGAQPAAPAMNDDFVGVYPLEAVGDYAARVAAWLRNVGDRPLLMCHPGSPAGTMAHALARAAEGRYFRSDEWPQLLRAIGLTLVSARTPGA